MSNESLDITPTKAGVRFAVRVKPKAAQSKIVGCSEGALEVRIAAPPVDGAANDALVRLLAKQLGVPRGRIAIVGGASSRHKRIEIEGVDAAALARLLAGG